MKCNRHADLSTPPDPVRPAPIPPAAPAPALFTALRALRVISLIGLDAHGTSPALSLAPAAAIELRGHELTGGTHADVLKLARLLWHLIKHPKPYAPTVWQLAEAKPKLKNIQRLRPSATALGFRPITTT